METATQSQNITRYMIPFICNVKDMQTYRDSRETGGLPGVGEEQMDGKRFTRPSLCIRQPKYPTGYPTSFRNRSPYQGDRERAPGYRGTTMVTHQRLGPEGASADPCKNKMLECAYTSFGGGIIRNCKEEEEQKGRWKVTLQ